jgi:ABC-type metal ion transport system substrate-binding protein
VELVQARRAIGMVFIERKESPYVNLIVVREADRERAGAAQLREGLSNA